jgi:TolB protein
MDIDGNNLRPLTEGGTIDERPLITPDGKWVVFGSLRFGTNALWKVSIDGGEPVQLTNRPAEGASISPDGKTIACLVFDGKPALGLLPIYGGEFVKTLDLPESVVSGLAWTPDGRSVTYLDDGSGYTNIVSRPIDGGPVKQLTNFKSDRGYRIFSFAWTRDGKQLIYSRGPFTDDIVLIKDFR